MDAKTTGIVAYLSWIGLLIALLAGDKEGAKFHINQALILFLFTLPCLAMPLSIIPFIGWIIPFLIGGWEVFVFVCWAMGIRGAVKGEEKPVPLLGSIRILK